MAEGSARGEPAGARAFRALLALYPAAFRDEYGRELALVFVDRYRGAADPWARARLWLEAAAGILAEAPREHLRVIRQDLAYAWRALRQHALVTATIALTLGLGIGANTAVFSLLNAVVLRSPVTVPDAGRLFTVNGGRHAASGPESARLSGPMFDVLRESAPPGVTVAAMSRGVARVYTRVEGERETTPASLQLVSSGFLRVLGLSPGLGRDLPAGVDAGDAGLALVSHGYWQRRLGGAPGVVGQALTINGAAFTIAGVGPPGFSGVWLETPVDIWAPLAAQSAIRYSQSFSADGADLARPWLPQAQIWWLHAVVRVPSGRPAAAAAAFNASLSARAGRDAGVVLEPFTRGLSQVRRQFSTPLRALLVMAGLVLLVACANVANVLLARAVGRQREMAVRMAMGAGRSRLFHQLLTESALLVALAGAVAVVFAAWAGRALVRVATAAGDGLPPFDAPIDLRVLGFAAGTAFLSVLVFGAWPAWRATRLDVVVALRSGARASMGGAGRPARVLVVAQVALSLVLVTATALFVRSFQHLLEVDPGVEHERLLTLGIDPRLSGAPPEALPAMYDRVIDAVARVPGVESASLAMCGLQGICATEDGFLVEGRQSREDERVAFAVNVVTPGYFSTVGMRLVAGRALTDRDQEGTPKVAVVNRTLAARSFGEWPRALGRRVGLGTPDIEIVGIVEDARVLGDVRQDVRPALFVPLAQRAVVPRVLEIRTAGDPARAGDAVRRALAGAAPELPVESAVTAEERLRRGLGRDRLVILLTSGFGALALGLAGLGLFGVLSYAVARRVPELGLRLALGASPSNLRWSVVRDALRLVLTGVAVGLPFVLAGGSLVSSMVFGVSPRDAASVGAAAIVLLAVGVACSLLPAHRAARVDPVVALSEE